MADVDQVVREAKSRAQAAEREQKSTAKLADEAKAESRRARLEYKKARKAFKKATKAARKARKAAEDARARLLKVSRKKKSTTPKAAAKQEAAAKPAATAKAKAAPATRKAAVRKAVKRRTVRPAGEVIARPQFAQSIDDAETFHMSEADLNRER